MTIRTATWVLIAAASVWPASASADLRFCNNTGANATVAIAYGAKDAPGTSTNGHQGVTEEGWWTFAPNECAKVSDIHVGNHWVYFHAHSRTGQWAGPSMLCVPNRRFTTGGTFHRPGDACPQGQELKGFQRIDSSARTFTMTLR